jgi:asparagine synthase (glutamine-hydrolysing)
MCGIAGFIDPSGVVRDPNTLLEAMASKMAHRGPDGSGAWWHDGARVGLAHRRLAIIDPTPDGAQPMRSHCGRWTITFNGEVYNYQELRKRLEREGYGYSWRGSSDTEVLLASLSHWGIDAALEQANGMFAFAAWSEDTRCLYLARDRFGEKPLYWARAGDGFVFASELKSLLMHPSVHRALSVAAVSELLQFGYVPAPNTIYENIAKLAPGTVLEWSGGVARVRQYWSAVDVAASAVATRIATDETDALDRLEQIFTKSVKARMVSDVPLGAFLSGGIDSSLVVALMQAESTRKVRSFTIGFEDPDFDESGHAAEVARHLGTDHTSWTITSREALDVVPLLPQMYCEPFADSSQIPTFLVSKLTRQHVTVAVSGDGGDELFCGYNRYAQADSIWRRLESIGPARGIAASTASLVPAKFWRSVGAAGLWPLSWRLANPGLDLRIAQQSRLIATDSLENLYRLFVSSWSDARDIVPAPMRAANPWPASAWQERFSPMESMMLADMTTYLSEDILVKVDRATMAASLEARTPYLDPDVFALAWQLPIGFKRSSDRGKSILRKLLYRYVPEALVERPKKGFAVPLAAWLRGPLREWADDLLAPSALRSHGLFDEDAVAHIWRAHLEGDLGFDTQLWPILMLQQWYATSMSPGRV